MGERKADEAGVGPPGIKTFLIADVRGYTLFTQQRGDEAAAKLAARFAEIAREAVDDHGGSVIELRGDEALAVFDSPRQAIRAATRAQERFVEETESDPSLPLAVGIRIDAKGEGISSIASGGKSQAGQHGAPVTGAGGGSQDVQAGHVPNGGGTGTAGAARHDATDTTTSHGDPEGRSSADSGNASSTASVRVAPSKPPVHVH